MNEIIAEEAHDNYENIIGVKNRIGKDLLILGQLLKINHDNHYYKTLNYDTWGSFLAIPELKMSRFWAFKLMKVYEIWIDKYGVSPAKLNIDIESLWLTTTMGLNKNNYEEMLEQARSLSRSDLRQLKSGKEYEFGERYKMITCPMCGHEFRQVI